MRRGDSVVIDPVTRTVLSVNGEPCTELTPELQALINEHLGPPEKPSGNTSPRREEPDTAP